MTQHQIPTAGRLRRRRCGTRNPSSRQSPTVRCRNVIPVTIGDSTIMSEAFFTVDGDSYLPSVMARGPWGAAMGGQIVGGLLGWGIEQSGVDPDLQPARLTVDLLRPTLLEPVQIQTSVQREGRRIKLVDGALLQNGNTCRPGQRTVSATRRAPRRRGVDRPGADAAASNRLR